MNCEYWSTMLEVLEYQAGSTGVLCRKYGSTLPEILDLREGKLKHLTYTWNGCYYSRVATK